MDDAGRPEALQAGAAVVQAILLPLAIYLAYRTVREASAARREEAERFHVEQQDDRKRRRAEADKARQADLERRLTQVVEAVMALEELRLVTSSGSATGFVHLPVARRRLETSIIATGMELPKTRALAVKTGTFQTEAEVQEALAELTKSLRILAMAARVPFEDE